MLLLKRFLLTLLSLATVFVFSISFAHSGGTDSQGGHYNHSTGEYHFHHGYHAHQHPNGVCPYDDDASSRSAPRKSYSTATYAPMPTPKPTVRPTVFDNAVLFEATERALRVSPTPTPSPKFRITTPLPRSYASTTVSTQDNSDMHDGFVLIATLLIPFIFAAIWGAISNAVGKKPASVHTLEVISTCYLQPGVTKKLSVLYVKYRNGDCKAYCTSCFSTDDPRTCLRCNRDVEAAVEANPSAYPEISQL